MNPLKMTNYIEQRLSISDSQKEKIKLAIKNKEPVTIRIENTGDDLLALTTSQINKINKAFQNDKSVDIKLSKAQLQYNKNKVEGGFIGLLARAALPLVARAVPQIAKHLALGALAGTATNLVNKILGKGLYLKKGGCVCKVKDQGSGLYLSPKNPKEFEKYGDGLYVKTDQGEIHGEGIISDITKDIPLLNILI